MKKGFDLEKHLCGHLMAGRGFATAAVKAVNGLKAKEDGLKELLDKFHTYGIWVEPTVGKYRGRPCWVEDLGLVGGNGIYAHVRIPSLKGNNEHVDDHYNRTVYLQDCEFVRPMSVRHGAEIVTTVTVRHFLNRTSTTPYKRTNINIIMERFIR